MTVVWFTTAVMIISNESNVKKYSLNCKLVYLQIIIYISIAHFKC